MEEAIEKYVEENKSKFLVRIKKKQRGFVQVTTMKIEQHSKWDKERNSSN